MSTKSYLVKEVARLTGVTVRTLHHYDSLGLLVPSERSQAGYRLYCNDDLLRLQQILICRELGMPLEEIRRMLDDPGFDRKEALLAQRERLREQVQNAEAMLRSVEAALAATKGESDMDLKAIFDGFDPKEHEAEVKERWGDTEAFRESARRTQGYTPEDWKRIKAEDQALMAALAETMATGSSSEDPEVLELAERHRLHIDRWYYPCPHSMHVQLASMYTADPRFTATFEKHGEGLAEFFAEAIRANAGR